MKDYTFYIAAAYGIAAVVLAGLILQSVLAARKAARLTDNGDA